MIIKLQFKDPENLEIKKKKLDRTHGLPCTGEVEWILHVDWQQVRKRKERIQW